MVKQQRCHLRKICVNTRPRPAPASAALTLPFDHDFAYSSIDSQAIFWSARLPLYLLCSL